MSATIRAARPPDLPAIGAVMAAAGEPVDWPGRPGWPYLEGLIDRPGVRLIIAEAHGRTVGMAASIPLRDDVRFLTDLFVEPGAQSSGIGRALLAAALDGAAHRLTFSSADPRALAAYLRQGMRPWWPLLYLTLPRAACAPIDAAHGPEAASPADVASLSRAWTGLDREPEARRAARLPGASIVLVRDAADQPVAIAWSSASRGGPGRSLHHATLAPAADPVAAATSVLASAIGDADRLTATIPGPHPVVPHLLERGARIVDRDTFCATDPALVDPERLLPDPGSL